jgi:hypothetical protein
MRDFAHTRTAPRAEPGLPRPARAALPYAALLVASPVFVAGHALSVRAGAAAAAAAVAAAVGAWAWSVVARTQLRDRADRFIATGAGEAPSPAVLAERQAELVRREERRSLAATLRHIAASAERPPVRSARVPLDAAAICAERSQIERLAVTLAETDVPVPARGVARTSVLVTDGGSPLYRTGPGAADELHRRLIQTLYELESGERR